MAGAPNPKVTKKVNSKILDYDWSDWLWRDVLGRDWIGNIDMCLLDVYGLDELSEPAFAKSLSIPRSLTGCIDVIINGCLH